MTETQGATKKQKSGLPLLAEHRQVLYDAGLTDEVISERGHYSVTTRTELRRAGFTNRDIVPKGTIHPLHTVRGEQALNIFRADEPRYIKGRFAKYEFPANAKPCLDVPPRCLPMLGDPTVPLIWTEGTKQADAGAVVGFCMVNARGTYGWRGTNEFNGKAILPDLEHIAFKDKRGRPRKVYLCFDSDAMEKPQVYAALKRLKDLLERRGAKVRIIYLPTGDNGQKTGLDDYLAQGNGKDDVLALASKMLKAPPGERHTGELQSVEEAIEGIPAHAGLMVPANYELGEGGILGVSLTADLEERRTAVAPAPVIIAGRTTDIHDGRESAELLYKRGGQWRRQSVSRATISNTREIVKLSDFGLPVTSGNAGELVDYLGNFDTANIKTLPNGKTSAQMGWQGRTGSEGFLWGRRLLTAGQPIPDTEIDLEEIRPEDWPEDGVMFKGADVGDEQLAGGFAPSGTFEEWRHTMRQLDPFPKIMLAVVASLAAPVLEVVGGYNFIVDLANTTSRGKTVTLRLAASCWGNPDERAPESILGTWDATRVWIERASATLNSMPLLLDDTKRARHPRIVAQTLYDVANGKGRGRGSLQGLGRSGSWSTVLLSTGEQPATTFTEDGGTRARVLTLWGSPFEVVGKSMGELVSRLDFQARENYGHAGPRFVKFLLDNRDSWPQYREKHKKFKREYTERAGGDPVLGRMADYFATLRLTAELTAEHILPWGAFDPIAPLWDALAGEASESDRAESALRFVLSWADANRTAFYGRERQDGYSGDPLPPHGGYAGKWDEGQWEYIAFYPHKIKQLLEGEGFDADSTLRTWREREWLQTDKGSNKPRNTKRLRIRGELTRAVAITREAFTEAMS
jgi:hypothetical protein